MNGISNENRIQRDVDSIVLVHFTLICHLKKLVGLYWKLQFAWILNSNNDRFKFQALLNINKIILKTLLQKCF